ncbi:hypothetical protein L842_6241 [Mycobacterium intracellulare MIN_052511_1280]|nr:hypothetical protein L842_6241 [Mycobacterium intracellulare MIN_052511_1280]
MPSTAAAYKTVRSVVANIADSQSPITPTRTGDMSPRGRLGVNDRA